MTAVLKGFPPITIVRSPWAFMQLEILYKLILLLCAKNLKPYQYVNSFSYGYMCSHRRIIAVCCYQEKKFLV